MCSFTGALIATYIHGQGIDEPISMTRGGNTYFYTFDGLGSVKDLTDATQTLVEQYDYDSFGNPTTPPTTGNPYTYTAREYDPETGMYFYRARYYDPKVGRFLIEDPIGFEGGDVNFYMYVDNNPTNFIDPLGKETCPSKSKPKDCLAQFREDLLKCSMPDLKLLCYAACLLFIENPRAFYTCIEVCATTLTASYVKCVGDANKKFNKCLYQ